MPYFDFYSDTDPRAFEVWVRLQRKMTPGEKIQLALSMSAMLMRCSEAGVREMYPHADDREVFLRMAARRLDRETMIRVYGWDPEDNHDRTQRRSETAG
ncbi:MAG: hypothetical protein HYR60_00715 [Acidobacteria bacterium]|nr:hypothetical protein [Acidobacteriota bacterium]